MKNIKNRILLIIILILNLNLVGCSLNNEYMSTNKTENTQQEVQKPIYLGDGTVLYPDGTMSLGEGSVAYGFYDINKKLIDPGGILQTIDNKITGYVELAQNLKGNKDYLLIVMCDFKQQEFLINGDSYKSYNFSLQDSSDISINIELPCPDNTVEFEFLIFLNPDIKELSMDTADEWNEFNNTSTVYSNRLFINKIPDKTNYILDTSYYTKMKDVNNTCMLTKSASDYILLPECNSNDSVKLEFGNIYEEDLICVLIAFQNWEQVPIANGQLCTFVEIMPDQNYYYHIQIPEVNTNTCYQVIMFYQPFNIDSLNYLPNNSTNRTIIKN